MQSGDRLDFKCHFECAMVACIQLYLLIELSSLRKSLR